MLKSSSWSSINNTVKIKLPTNNPQINIKATSETLKDMILTITVTDTKKETSNKIDNIEVAVDKEKFKNQNKFMIKRER